MNNEKRICQEVSCENVVDYGDIYCDNCLDVIVNEAILSQLKSKIDLQKESLDAFESLIEGEGDE